MEKITQQEIESVYVQGAPTKLTGSAQENKQVFDKLPLMVVSKINDIIDELSSGGGADSINGSYNGIVMSLQGIVDMIATEIGEIEANYLPKSGDTMTGDLVLNADPTADLGAATKQFVENAVKTAYDKAEEAKTVADAAATPEYVDATVEQFAQGALQTVENNYLPLTGGMIKNPDEDSTLVIVKSVKSTDPNDDVDSIIGIVGLSVGDHPLNEDAENPQNGAHLLLLNGWLSSGLDASATIEQTSIKIFGSSRGSLALVSDVTNSRNLLTGLTEPVDPTDAVNKQYVDDAVAGVSGDDSGCNCKHYYGECTTSPTTAAKIVTVSGNFVLEKGASIDVMFTYHNTASSPTMNVNGTGAKAIKKYNTSAEEMSYRWAPNSITRFTYDGTYWFIENGTEASTTYYGVTKLNNTVTSTSTQQAATANAVKQAYDLANQAMTKANEGGSFSDAVGIYGVTTTFNSDGSITEVYANNATKTTTFNTDGSITEVYVSADSQTQTKTTTFNDNVITSVVQ